MNATSLNLLRVHRLLADPNDWLKSRKETKVNDTTKLCLPSAIHAVQGYKITDFPYPEIKPTVYKVAHAILDNPTFAARVHQNVKARRDQVYAEMDAKVIGAIRCISSFNSHPDTCHFEVLDLIKSIILIEEVCDDCGNKFKYDDSHPEGCGAYWVNRDDNKQTKLLCLSCWRLFHQTEKHKY